MSEDTLDKLAAAVGLIRDWEDIDSRPQRVTPDAVRAILSALGHPCETEAQCRESLAALADAPPSPMQVIQAGRQATVEGPPGRAQLVLESGEACDIDLEPVGGKARLPPIDQAGYHRLEAHDRELILAVCPPRCVTPHDLLGRRAWGLTVQVYALAGPGGFGDFGDLARFAAAFAKAGADALAISPTHALFAADPHRYSPYSPSSRDYLNPLLADPGVLGDAVPTVDAPALIDWPQASPAKLTQLTALRAKAEADSRFARFIADGGPELRRHALFEALHAHFAALGEFDWRKWPQAFQDPTSAEAAARDLPVADAVQDHLVLQWLADLSLDQAQRSARDAGIGLGLIADLAVGLDPAGSHAWSRPQDLLSGLTLGAPPDAFQSAGQGWGITTFAPEALRRQAFAPFLTTVRAALRYAGGLRIDHALGLKRLWVLPQGASPTEGAYLRNPMEELLALIALESHRAGAVVIGEDLGVVPPGLRDTLIAHGLLGMRVLPFEREDEAFRPPAEWDVCAAAMTSTHDLPPTAGWWRGRDIAWRETLDAEGDRAAEARERASARSALWQAAISAGTAEGPEPLAEDPAPAVDAAVAMVAATPCELALVPIEDLMGLDEQVNLPGVVEVHPNWRRRLPSEAEAILADPAVARRIERLEAERPR